MEIFIEIYSAQNNDGYYKKFINQNNQMDRLLKNLGKQKNKRSQIQTRNYNQHSKKVARNLSDHSFLPSWNKSQVKIGEYNSFPKNKKSHNQTYSFLAYENQKLKQQIKLLQQLIIKTNHKEHKYERINYESKVKTQSSEEEIIKLKGVIQKSYYSIKKMEEHIKDLTINLQRSQRNCEHLHKKLKVMELQKDESHLKLNSMASIHKQQIYNLNDKIGKLQSKIQKLITLMSEDHEEWRKHMKELNNLKKFYLQGTLK